MTRRCVRITLIMNVTARRLGNAAYCVFIALFAVAVASADWQMGMQEPANEMADIQRDLHFWMMAVIIVIGALVFGAMFYSIIKHRKDKGYQAAHFHENTLVEIIWTAVPMLIIVGMALPATSAIIKYKDTSVPDLTVKVTGYQWKWSYDYLDKNVFYYSQLSTAPEEIGGKYYQSSDVANPQSDNYLLEVDNEMVVPVGQKVRLLLTAADVIHAWWVPQLGVKQDAIPGLVRDAWFRADKVGVYRGQCAELCGKNHGFMPIVVRAVEAEEFEAWLKDNAGEATASDEPVFVGDAAQIAAASAAEEEPVDWTMDTAMERGEAAYNTYCAACHQVNGEGLPPAFPALKDSPVAVGDIDEHIDVVINGESGTAMAAFNYLSDADLAAIVTYERNAWGNDTGDLTTPDDIKAAR